jgi:formate C-acetyltransferase
MLRIPSIHKKFSKGKWMTELDVRNFIQQNYKPYDGGDAFLKAQTPRTKKLLKKVQRLLKKEFKKGGVKDIDVDTPSTITSHEPGYIEKKLEIIHGLQTDEPLKRAIKLYGGVRLVEKSCEAYGHTLNPLVKEMFGKYVRTHNDAVFNVYKYWRNFYTPDNMMLRKTGVITGLPDNYGRGRIIGDYRRIALYGVDRLIDEKIKEQEKICVFMDEKNIRLREEIADQIMALKDMRKMAESYGFDIGRPAEDTKEAVQWLYFGYLAAVKEQDGAAMSLGRIDSFLDIYAEMDLRRRKYSESEIQEVIDQFVIKLRMVRHLRHPLYNELFAGDPTWITCALGGVGVDGRALVTKMSYRILHTLKNLGPAPEPNMTVLWAQELPENFKCFASKISIDSSSIQFENDELMRKLHTDDYAIACCVSAMTVGKEMQFFGARCNLPKLLLMAINEGRDEFDGNKIVEGVAKLKSPTVLNYVEVKKEFFKLMKWLAKRYVETINLIHYMHDHYNYEKGQMALHDALLERSMAFGVAGLSIVTDSLSAIKHCKVKAIRGRDGIARDFKIKGEFPCFGNNDDKVDKIAIEVVREFVKCLKKNPAYRDAEHTLSLLTITSNVVYGKKTGATPDGRKAHEPFAPGANPMHNRDKKGALASLNSVAKIPYNYCRDGISNTFSITPATLGKDEKARINNLKGMLDGYFEKGGHHININALHREVLEDAMKRPHKYPNLTIRVSGYAVHFIKLTKEQQEEVLSRTFHKQF